MNNQDELIVGNYYLVKDREYHAFEYGEREFVTTYKGLNYFALDTEKSLCQWAFHKAIPKKKLVAWDSTTVPAAIIIVKHKEMQRIYQAEMMTSGIRIMLTRSKNFSFKSHYGVLLADYEWWNIYQWEPCGIEK